MKSGFGVIWIDLKGSKCHGYLSAVHRNVDGVLLHHVGHPAQVLLLKRLRE